MNQKGGISIVTIGTIIISYHFFSSNYFLNNNSSDNNSLIFTEFLQEEESNQKENTSKNIITHGPYYIWNYITTKVFTCSIWSEEIIKITKNT